MSSVRRRKTAHLDMRVEPELITKIDKWRDRQLVRPSRAAAITFMITAFLDHDAHGGDGIIPTKWPGLT